MAADPKKLKKLAEAGSSADRIRALAKEDGPIKRGRKSLAQSPAVGEIGGANRRSNDIAMARQLVMSPDPADRAVLHNMYQSLSPAGQENFKKKLLLELRDPRSPADAPTLTAEGRLISDVAESGVEPPAEVLESIRQSGDIGGFEDATVSNLEPDPVRAPVAPKSSQDDALPTPSRHPSMEVFQDVAPDGSGGYKIKTTSSSLEKQTNAAIEKAKRGETPDPISDSAVRREATPSAQPYANTLRRVTQVVDPRASGRGAFNNFDLADELGIPVPDMAVGGKSIRKRSANKLAATTAGDIGDLQFLMERRGITQPGTFQSSEDLARAIIGGSPQEMFGNADVQAQAVENLSRKLEEFYGADGWGLAPEDAPVRVTPRGKTAKAPAAKADLEPEISRSTEDELNAFESRNEMGDVQELDPSELPPVKELPEPTPYRERQSTNAQTQSEFNAARAERRRQAIEAIKETGAYKGEEPFLTEQTADELRGLLREEGDPVLRRQLQRQLRAAQLVESYMQPPVDVQRPYQAPLRMPAKKKRGKTKPKADNPADLQGEALDNAATDLGTPEPPQKPLDLNGKPADDAPAKMDEVVEGAGKNADDAASGDKRSWKQAAVDAGKYAYNHPFKTAAKLAIGGSGTIGLLSWLNSGSPEGDAVNRLPGSGDPAGGDAGIDPALAEGGAFTQAVGGGVRPVVMSPEERLRILSQSYNAPLNKKTQTLSNWRE